MSLPSGRCLVPNGRISDQPGLACGAEDRTQLSEIPTEECESGTVMDKSSGYATVSNIPDLLNPHLFVRAHDRFLSDNRT